MSQIKIYPAKEVIPFKSPILNTIKALQKGQAVNFSNKKIASVRSVISRLHKESKKKFTTVKVSQEEFAVIREE